MIISTCKTSLKIFNNWNKIYNNSKIKTLSTYITLITYIKLAKKTFFRKTIKYQLFDKCVNFIKHNSVYKIKNFVLL